jgi:hypothetical protein
LLVRAANRVHDDAKAVLNRKDGPSAGGLLEPAVPPRAIHLMRKWSTTMDTPDLRPEARDQDQVDPIGPPVLEARVRYGARALALSGVAVGAALVTHVLDFGTMTPPLN